MHIIQDPSGEVVMTPLTERCFLNLSSSINSIKVGTLIGSGSSGKNQTVHLLAQVFIDFF